MIRNLSYLQGLFERVRHNIGVSRMHFFAQRHVQICFSFPVGAFCKEMLPKLFPHNDRVRAFISYEIKYFSLCFPGKCSETRVKRYSHFLRFFLSKCSLYPMPTMLMSSCQKSLSTWKVDFKIDCWMSKLFDDRLPLSDKEESRQLGGWAAL